MQRRIPAGIPAGDSGQGVVRADAPEILARIVDPWIGLALWRRAPPADIVAALDALPFIRLPQGRVLAGRRGWSEAVGWLLENARIADLRVGRYLGRDILEIADRFARIAGTELVDLRLEAIAHDACWKFHRDNTRLRLITTYRGPGTQVVAAEHAAAALRQQRDYRGPLEELPRFAVALFKGSRASYPDDGIVHRSPPIAGSGEVRLVLCLDERSEASPPPWRG